jgi:hypothetical protein
VLGVLCLHRSASAKGFDVTDLDFVWRVAPDLARGLRRSITLYPARPNVVTAGPGIIILGPDLAIVSVNPAAETLLADIVDADWPAHLDLPVTIFAAATRLPGVTVTRSRRKRRPGCGSDPATGSPCTFHSSVGATAARWR